MLIIKLQTALPVYSVPSTNKSKQNRSEADLLMRCRVTDTKDAPTIEKGK